MPSLSPRFRMCSGGKISGFVSSKYYKPSHHQPTVDLNIFDWYQYCFVQLIVLLSKYESSSSKMSKNFETRLNVILADFWNKGDTWPMLYKIRRVLGDKYLTIIKSISGDGGTSVQNLRLKLVSGFFCHTWLTLSTALLLKYFNVTAHWTWLIADVQKSILLLYPCSSHPFRQMSLAWQMTR